MKSIYDEIYQSLKPRVKNSAWIVSDLQQSLPENAKHCLDITLEDFNLLGKPAEMIWYLGDSVERWDLSHLEAMTKMQIDGFGSLNIPLCYVTGNHDYDYMRYRKEELQLKAPIMPFYDAVRAKEGWHTTKTPQDLYFKVKLGDYPVYFFSDHIDNENRWLVTHSHIVYGEEFYPYTQKDADAIRQEIINENHGVITASHYCMPGGNRDSYLMSKLTPLPENVLIHFYGHSHIGDFEWGGKDAYRRIAWVDFEDIPQIDVASMENIRGSFCRSALLQIYDDDTMAVFFRNHDAHCFTEVYFPAKDKQTLTIPHEERQRIIRDHIHYV